MNKVRLLKYYFLFFGLFNVLIVFFTVPILFGDLLLWQPRNLPIEIMISVIYLAMGIIMIFSASNPLAHKSFLDFVIMANILHAIIMAVYSKSLLQLIFDAIPIGLMGVVPLLFYPWNFSKFIRY